MTTRQISAAEIAATVDGLRPLSDQFRAAAEKYDAWAREYSAEPPPDRWSEYNEFDGQPEERLLEIRSRQAGELVYPLLRAGVLRVLPPPDKLLHEPVGIDYLYERADFYDLWWLAFVGWLNTLSLNDTRPTPGESYPTHVFWDWKPGIGVCSSKWLGYDVKCRIKFGQDACLQSAAAIEYLVERIEFEPIDNADTTSDVPNNVFRRHGSFWEVRFNSTSDRPLSIKHSVGMVYLWHMLRQERGKPVAALDLKHLADGMSKPRRRADEDHQNSEDDDWGGHAAKRAPDQDVVADEETLRRCHDEMVRLRSERDELCYDEHKDDPAAQARVKEIDAEYDSYRRYVSSATGLRGHPRPLGANDSKRASDTVRAGLERAYKQIADAGLLDLADWLKAAIITGREVRYRPSEPVDWVSF